MGYAEQQEGQVEVSDEVLEQLVESEVVASDQVVEARQEHVKMMISLWEML